jgi:head-tail adaptor
LSDGAGARDNRLRRIAATLRYRSNVRLGQRLRFAEADYDIVSVEITDGKERFMILVCEEAAP